MYIELELNEFLSTIKNKIKNIYINDVLTYEFISIVTVLSGDMTIGEYNVNEYYSMNNKGIKKLLRTDCLKHTVTTINRVSDNSVDSYILEEDILDLGEGYNCCAEIVEFMIGRVWYQEEKAKQFITNKKYLCKGETAYVEGREILP